MKKFLSLLLIIAAIISCKKDDDPTPTPQAKNPYEKMVEALQSNGNFNSFLSAAEYAEMENVIENQGFSAMIFAPNDNAFSVYMQEQGITDLSAFANADRANELMFTVLSGGLTLDNLDEGYYQTEADPTRVETKNGTNVFISASTRAATPSLYGSAIISDLGVYNDSIIVNELKNFPTMPSFMDMMTEDPKLSEYEEAILRLLQMETFMNDSSAMTVLAFSADATSGLAQAFGVNALSEMTTEEMQAFIDRNIIEGEMIDFTSIEEPQTFQNRFGSEVTIAPLLLLNRSAASYRMTYSDLPIAVLFSAPNTNIQTDNGMMHIYGSVSNIE
ncbi:MAG: hypothetical protein ACEPOV_02595 [Hyphomicrobiales bacterium]